VVSARLVDQRLVKLGTVPGRKPKHRARAEAFVAHLEADRAHFCTPDLLDI